VNVQATLASTYPHVQVIAERGTGLYAAIDDALTAVADWDAFTYLNDDDVLLPAFARLRGIAERESRRGGAGAIVYGGVRLIDAEGRRLGRIPVSPWPALNRALYAARIEPVYQHGTVIPRATVGAIGGFDRTLRCCGDTELLARACVRRVKFCCAGPREVAAFRLRPGQLTKNRPAMDAERLAVDERLGLRNGVSRTSRALAWSVFRAANIPAYVERWRRHGFVRFDDVLARAG
jgi:hypothetical protein